MRRWLVLGLFALAWLAPGLAAAQGACARALERWNAACPEVELVPVACPPGAVVVRLEAAGAAAFDVEVRARDGGELVSARGVGFRPVGEYADWSSEPAARRRALDALVACVRDGAMPPVAAAPEAGQPGRGSPPAPALPWLLLAASLAALAAAVRALRGGQWRWRAWGVGSASVVLVWGLRWFAYPVAPFHQNGQAALWIRAALEDRAGLLAYGPGYAETFGWVAALAPARPELAVYLANAVLGALLPVCGWLVARRAGARRWLAGALALALAVDPLLARFAQSESYFGAIVGLAGLAAAALAVGAHRGGFGARFWLGCAGAGLLVAQAARIHPIGWPALALLPLVVLVQPGRVRLRLAQTAAAGGAVALLVAATSWRALADALSGPIGAKWLPATPWPVSTLAVALGALAVALLVAWWWPRARVAVGLAVVALALVAGVLASPVKRDVVWVAEAYPRQLAPVLVAGVAAALARALAGRAQRYAALLLVLGACLHAGFRRGTLGQLPADSLESMWFVEQRSQIADGATVAYLARAGERAFLLPLYPSHDRRGRHDLPLRASGPVPDLSALPGEVYYYRSSLCSTPEGRERCHRIEQGLELERLGDAAIPPIASQPWHPLGPGAVDVSLFRVLKRER